MNPTPALSRSAVSTVPAVSHPILPRRRFLGGLFAGTAALAASTLATSALEESPTPTPTWTPAPEPWPRADFRGRNVILVRFGGGTRRRESIEPANTYAPYLCRTLIPQGTLFPRMEIAQLQGLNTSHGEGTLNLLTGRYDRYEDVQKGFLKARFEPKVPTLGEYLRREFDVAPHETLIVNGEDRPDEEFYTFSNHAAYGVNFRSNVLSLYRFKRWLFEQQIAEGKLTSAAAAERREQLAKWEKSDARSIGHDIQGPKLEAFWRSWREFYGDTGLVNPRGDRLLTTLALRALRELRPRFLMINYNDCDYVHWGYLNHYTSGIAIMDEGLRELHAAVQTDPALRDNTVFVIAPDCGRDSNPLAAVPCQHHFNSRSSHEIFALLVGPGVPHATLVDQPCQQVDVAPTIGQILGCPTPHSEGRVLAEAFA